MSAPSRVTGWLKKKNVPPFFWQPAAMNAGMAGVPAPPDGLTKKTMRPASKSPGMLYVRSYLALRTIVGALGVLLPPLAIFGARYLFSESMHFPRTSISDYYYSGSREIFVDTLAATGVFFVAYKILEANAENLLSVLAGLAAVTISLFPTGKDTFEQSIPNNGTQKLIGAANASDVHYGASIVFLVCLTLISVCFGIREGKRTKRPTQTVPPIVWKYFHWGCALAMAIALLGVIVMSWKYALLTGEIVCALAFGASWFAKGFEINALIHGQPE
jgi:Protein of unknown function (DUF998)